MTKVYRDSITIRNFKLERGETLPEAKIEFETYGKLAPDRGNAILILHGLTNSHHSIGEYPGRPVGSGQYFVGPNLTLDTEKYFVISPANLGSCYGSTNASSINPVTGRRFGSSFPHLTLGDIVNAHYELIKYLEIERLLAITGGSFGGSLAFQWAVSHPEMMAAIAPIVGSPRNLSSGGDQTDELMELLEKDPNWNGGDYYDGPSINETVVRYRIRLLKSYGIESHITGLDESQRETEIRKQAQTWADSFDINSLIIFRKAVSDFNLMPRLSEIRCAVFYVLLSSDQTVPPSVVANETLRELKKARVDVTFREIETTLGHHGWRTKSIVGIWGPLLKEFLAERL